MTTEELPGSKSSQLYSTILSLSELRTIYFFVTTIDKVQNWLVWKTKQETPSVASLPGNSASLSVRPDAKGKPPPETLALRNIVSDPTDRNDLDMIEKQTDDLAQTYLSIRHGCL